jgi:hypothetical protein
MRQRRTDLLDGQTLKINKKSVPRNNQVNLQNSR